ncbi:hypothetical protein AB0H34_35385 [Saccharopolyspora shandongensis]|uniref:hypothetical protein n=1 Tax=Saccharopolyspora shandongensis TaxID=418495 RepID=UPI0033F8EF8A
MRGTASEHFGVTSDEQVARLVRLGVVPVPQGRFISELGDGIIRALGPELVGGVPEYDSGALA